MLETSLSEKEVFIFVKGPAHIEGHWSFMYDIFKPSRSISGWPLYIHGPDHQHRACRWCRGPPGLLGERPISGAEWCSGCCPAVGRSQPGSQLRKSQAPMSWYILFSYSFIINTVYYLLFTNKPPWYWWIYNNSYHCYHHHHHHDHHRSCA